jgi:hypothetical protein
MNGLIVHTAARLRDKARVSARCSLRTPVQLVYEADMSKLYFELALVGGLVACGSNSSNTTDAPKSADAKVYLDAPTDSGSGSGSGSGDLSCNGDAAPTPNATVTISGVIDTVSVSGANISIVGLGSASVSACTGDCSTPLAAAGTTNGSGDVSFADLPTNGTALDGYLKITAGSDETTLAYPGAPIAADVTIQALVFPTAFLSELSIVGCTQAPAKGLVAIEVVDCSNAIINDAANITLSVQQNGTAVGDAPIDVGAKLAALGLTVPALNGFYLVCNVPVGATALGTKYKTDTFLTNNVMSVAGEATEAIIRPGY